MSPGWEGTEPGHSALCHSGQDGVFSPSAASSAGTSFSVGVWSIQGRICPRRPVTTSFWLWVPSGLCIWSWPSCEPIGSLYGLSLWSWAPCCCWHLKSSDEPNKPRLGRHQADPRAASEAGPPCTSQLPSKLVWLLLPPFQRRDTEAGRSGAPPSCEWFMWPGTQVFGTQTLSLCWASHMVLLGSGPEDRCPAPRGDGRAAKGSENMWRNSSVGVHGHWKSCS